MTNIFKSKTSLLSTKKKLVKINSLMVITGKIELTNLWNNNFDSECQVASVALIKNK